MKLPIKKTQPKKIGNSWYIRVPSDYVNEGLLEADKEQDLNIEIQDHKTTLPFFSGLAQTSITPDEVCFLNSVFS